MAPEIYLVALTGFFSSIISTALGVGGGTLIMGVLLLFLPPMAAVPFHGMIQLITNSWRIVLFWRDIQWQVVWRFALLMPVGAWLGIQVVQEVSPRVIQVLIGVLVLATLSVRRLPRLAKQQMPDWGFFPLGFVMGALAILVGIVATIIGPLVLRDDWRKEMVLATLAVCASTGHVLKIVAFGRIGFPVLEYLPALGVIAPALLLGGLAGRYLLTLVPERVFRIAFQALLGALALKLVLWDGLLSIYVG